MNENPLKKKPKPSVSPNNPFYPKKEVKTSPNNPLKIRYE